MGDKLDGKVLESAKLYAQLNYALANAAFAAWDTKYFAPPIPIPIPSLSRNPGRQSSKV